MKRLSKYFLSSKSVYSIEGSIQERILKTKVELKDLLEKIKDEYLYNNIQILIEYLEFIEKNKNLEKEHIIELLNDLLEKIKDIEDINYDIELYLNIKILEFQNIINYYENDMKIIDFNDLDANQFWNEYKLGYPLSDIQEKLKDIILLDPSSDSIISITDFQLLLSWFGPFKELIKNMNEICYCPYFYGSIESLETQTLLDNQKQGTFLFRFSEKDFGTFIISYIDDKKCKHVKILKKGIEYYLLETDSPEHLSSSILKLIEKYPLTFRYPFIHLELKKDRFPYFSNFRGFSKI